MTIASLYGELELVKIPNSSSFDQYWKLVEEQVQESESLQEWIPNFEREDSWTKSFGVQYYQLPEDYNIHYFYQMFIETLGQDFDQNKNIFHHEIIEETPNHIFFSWWCEGADYEIGREWVNIMKGDDHKILFVRFATKNSEIEEKDLLWVDCLKRAEFFKSAVEESEI